VFSQAPLEDLDFGEKVSDAAVPPSSWSTSAILTDIRTRRSSSHKHSRKFGEGGGIWRECLERVEGGIVRSVLGGGMEVGWRGWSRVGEGIVRGGVGGGVEWVEGG